MDRDRAYLQHILQAIAHIEEFLAGKDYADLLDDIKTQAAVVRELEIVGEASNNLSAKFRTTNSDIPWSKIISMRNRLIHDYTGVDYEVVWQTARESLPLLKKYIADKLD